MSTAVLVLRFTGLVSLCALSATGCGGKSAAPAHQAVGPSATTTLTTGPSRDGSVSIQAFSTPLPTVTLAPGATTQPPFPEKCTGTWKFVHGTLTVAVTTLGPALVSVVAATEAGPPGEATVNLPVGHKHVSASIPLRGAPLLVRTIVEELGATGAPVHRAAICTLARAGRT